MADEDQIKYTTFTGEDRNRENFKKTYAGSTSREVDNIAKQTTTWTKKGFRKTKGSTILNIINTDTTKKLPTTWKSDLNKSFNIDIDPNTTYWWNDKKVGAMADPNAEKELVSTLENAKLGSAVDNIAKNIGIKMDLVDDYAKQYNINPKVLGGVLARGGAAWLDPVSEAIEVAFGKIGLGGIAQKWVKGEMYGLAAAAIAGLITAGGGILGQKAADTTGRAVMDLYIPGYGDYIPELEEDYYVDSLINGIEVAAKGTELLPSSMIAKASAPVVDPMKDKIRNVIGAFK